MYACAGRNSNWKLNMKQILQYLHGIAMAIHSVLRAGVGGAITPVQVELQAVIGLGQISSWNLDTAVKDDFNWKRVEEQNVKINQSWTGETWVTG